MNRKIRNGRCLHERWRWKEMKEKIISALIGSLIVISVFVVFMEYDFQMAFASDGNTISDNGLVAYWDFDEGSGDIIHDNSGNGYDGKIYGAQSVDGISGKAIYLDGKDDYVDMGDVLDFDGDFTISVWIRTRYLNGHMEIVAKGENNYITPGYKIAVTENGYARGSILNENAELVEIQTKTMVVDGGWHIVVFTVNDFGRNKTTLSIYVDGEIENAKSHSTLNWDISNDAHLGIGLTYGAYAPVYFYGTIDEVKIYNRALSAEEIRQHYEAFMTPQEPEIINYNDKSAELFYDDKNDEFAFSGVPGGVSAVGFTSSQKVQITKLKFYLYGEMKKVKVHVLDPDFNVIFSKELTPHSGWFEVDISSEKIFVNGEFYIGFQWLTGSPNGPYLGVDLTPPHHNMSYIGWLGSWEIQKPGEDYMIHVEVSPVESKSVFPFTQISTIVKVIVIILFVIGSFFLIRKEKIKKFKSFYPNPYIAGNPIRSKDMFFGRKDVFKFIKNKLSVMRKNITIVLHGERRTGKTSVLYQIENGELGNEFVPVYIDIQEMAKVNEKEFFLKITEKIIESLKRNEIINFKSNEYFEINELLEKYGVELNPYQIFNKLLDRISNLLKEKYLILMFDEYEILDKKIENKHLSPDLIHYLRSQMQSRERFSFIFTGSKKLEDLKGKHWSLMFNVATYKKISFLEKKDALNLMRIPIDNRIHYDNGAIDKILRLTACHPYFLQLFLQNLVDHLNDLGKNRVTMEEINFVLGYILENPPPHMIFLWQDSTTEQKIILSALSEIIKFEDQYISIREVEEKLLENGARFDRDLIKKTFNELHQKELLDCKEDEIVYNFKIGLLRYWIRNEYPLFRIIEEIE